MAGRWDKPTQDRTSLNVDIDPRVGNIILELSADEFVIIAAALANTSYDCDAGPLDPCLINHKHARLKIQAILGVLRRDEIANTLIRKLTTMAQNLRDLSNI